MKQVYLTRSNLLALISKLDRKLAGQETARTLVKRDTVHPKYPCSDEISVTALEDEEYYTDRPAGEIHPADRR